MIKLESKTEQLDINLFRNPSNAYRSIPFWAWNCKVTEELIDEQLDIFQKMGFGGVDIHPRTGLDTVYLSDEYLRLVRFTVKRCKEKGLLCWLYDDDRFPSGAADGLVTQDAHFRQRCLLLTEKSKAGFLPDQSAFQAAVDSGEIPKGWYVASYAVGLQGVRRLNKGEAIRQDETLRHAYVMLLEPEEWFQGQTYVDVMNPTAIRRFLEITHEAYFQEVGGDFGGAVPAIFTDEPRMATRTNRYPKQLKDAASHEDVILPWSDALQERLMTQGADILDMVPALVWEQPGSHIARYTYRNAASEQFVSAFLDQIGDWCRAHHILFTGHVLSEDSLSAQAASLGDCMRCYRGMDIPGVDVLCDDRQFLTVKQAASVAHQMGKKGVASELYGVTEWNCDFKTYKLQGDWQAALGVTNRVPHLSWMSMEGEAKRDWPGSIFYQAPWWKEYHTIEDYFARLNTVLTRGKPMIDLAVIHPVESLWLHMGNNADTLKQRQEMDAVFDTLIRGLLLNLMDFDLISEALLPDQKPFIDEQGLHIGEMTYRTVIVPQMDTIRSTTLEVLGQFKQYGGRVIFAGSAPLLVDAAPSSKAAKLAASCEYAEGMENLYWLLKQEQNVSVQQENGCRSDRLIMQRRKDGDSEWLFFCHVWPQKVKTSTPSHYTIDINGYYSVTSFDPLKGETRSIAFSCQNGSTVIPWEAYAEDSLLLRLEKTSESAVIYREPALKKYSPIQTLLQPDSISFSEPNVLLLDYARAQVDEGTLLDKMEILQLDNMIRASLGFALRSGTMKQPYAIEEGKNHRITLHYDIRSEANMPCQLGIEHPERCHIWMNGREAELQDAGWYADKSIRKIRLSSLHDGVNHLRIMLPFNQKTNLESLYLLGDFDVQQHPAGNSTVTSRSCIKTVGDLTSQGLPFYSGKATYKFTFLTAVSGRFSVRVPLFAAALLTVSLDGQPMGQIAYAPHRLDLGTLSPGIHSLEIEAYIGRHNSFGYLHNCNTAFRWFGPDAWRTTGDEWTDSYMLKPCGLLSGILIERTEIEHDQYAGLGRIRL